MSSMSHSRALGKIGGQWAGGLDDDFLKRKTFLGFPGGTVVKNPPASAGDTGSSPGPRRSHMPRSN